MPTSMSILWHVELNETDPKQFDFFASGHHKASGEGRTKYIWYINNTSKDSLDYLSDSEMWIILINFPKHYAEHYY